MGRGLAADPEIARRGHQAAAEVPLPDPVDEHARRERIVPARKPVRQLAPPAPRWRNRQRIAAEDLDEPARHLRPGLVRLAAVLDAGVGRLALRHAIGDRVGGRLGDPLPLRGELAEGPVEGRRPGNRIGCRNRFDRRRRPGQREGHRLSADVVDVADRGRAGDMAQAVADERVDGAVPRGRQFHPLKRNRFRRRAFGREGGDRTAACLRDMVEGHANVVPPPRLEWRDRPPDVAVAEGKLPLRGGEVDRRRLDHAPAHVEATGAGRLFGPGGGQRAEVEADMEWSGGAGHQSLVERVPHPFVRLPGADTHAACACRVDVLPGALRLGEHGVGPSGEPRSLIRSLADFLCLEIEIDPAGKHPPLEELFFRADSDELPIDRRERICLLPVEPGRLLRGHQRREVGRALVLLAAGKGPYGALMNAVERVVVGGGDGIVLVVMAAGAAEREAEDAATERVDRVGEVEVLEVGVRRVTVALAHGEEAGGRDEVGVVTRLSVAGEDVTGHLPGEKLVVGQIVIEGPDHPVAVADGLADGVVGAVAGGVGVACDIEPVAAPALSVGVTGQEPVEDALPGVGGGVVEKSGNLVEGGGEAGEIERGAAEERAPIGKPGGHEAASFECGDDEAVDVVAHEPRVGHRGRYRRHRRLKAPPALGCLTIHATDAFLEDARVGGTGADPGGEVGDLCRRERESRILRRHRRDAVGMLHRAEQEACLRVSRHDRRPGVAPCLPALSGVEGKAAARLAGQGRVAALAAGGEERPDAALEEIVIGGVRQGRGAEHHRQERRSERKRCQPPFAPRSRAGPCWLGKWWLAPFSPFSMHGGTR